MGMIKDIDHNINDIRNIIKKDLVDLLSGENVYENILANIKNIRKEFYNKKTMISVAKEMDFDFIKSIAPNATENDFSGFSNIIKRIFIEKQFNVNTIGDFNRARCDYDKLKGEPNYINHNIRNFQEDEYDYGFFYKEIEVIDALKEKRLLVSCEPNTSLKDKIETYKKYTNERLTGMFFVDNYLENEKVMAIKNANLAVLDSPRNFPEYSNQNWREYYLQSLTEKFNEKKYQGILGQAESQAKKDYSDFKYGDITIKELFERIFKYDLDVGQEFVYHNVLKKMAKIDTIYSLLQNYHGEELKYTDISSSIATIKSFDLSKLINKKIKLNGNELADLKDRMPNKYLLKALNQINETYFYSKENLKVKNKKILDYIDFKIPSKNQSYKNLRTTLKEFSNEYGHELIEEPQHVKLRDYKVFNTLNNSLTNLKPIKNQKFDILVDHFGKEHNIKQLNNDQFYQKLDQALYNRINKEMSKGGLGQKNYENMLDRYISNDYIKSTYQNNPFDDLNLYVFMNKDKINSSNNKINLYSEFVDQRSENGITNKFNLNGNKYSNQELNNVLNVCNFYNFEFDGFDISAKLLKSEKDVELFKEIMKDSPKIIKKLERDLEIVKILNPILNTEERISLLNECNKEIYNKETLEILNKNGYQFSKKEMRALDRDRRKIYENAFVKQQNEKDKILNFENKNNKKKKFVFF